MQFHVLRETPADSGSYAATGEVLDVPGDVAIEAMLQRQADQGGRWAVFPYDSIRREPSAAPAPEAPAETVAEQAPEPAPEPEPTA